MILSIVQSFAILSMMFPPFSGIRLAGAARSISRPVLLGVIHEPVGVRKAHFGEEKIKAPLAVTGHEFLRAADPVVHAAVVQLDPKPLVGLDHLIVDGIPSRTRAVRLARAAGPLQGLETLKLHQRRHVADGVRSVQMIERVIEPPSLRLQRRQDKFPEVLGRQHGGEVALNLGHAPLAQDGERRVAADTVFVLHEGEHGVVVPEIDRVDVADKAVHGLRAVHDVKQSLLRAAHGGVNVDVFDEVGNVQPPLRPGRRLQLADEVVMQLPPSVVRVEAQGRVGERIGYAGRVPHCVAPEDRLAPEVQRQRPRPQVGSQRGERVRHKDARPDLMAHGGRQVSGVRIESLVVGRVRRGRRVGVVPPCDDPHQRQAAVVPTPPVLEALNEVFPFGFVHVERRLLSRWSGAPVGF